MLERHAAEAVALRYLEIMEKKSGIPLALCDSLTRATHGGWPFFYDSVAHAVHGDPTGVIAGNAPFLVINEVEVVITGTAKPVEDYLRNLAALRREPLPAES